MSLPEYTPPGDCWHVYKGVSDKGLAVTITVGPTDQPPKFHTEQEIYGVDVTYWRSFDHDPTGEIY